VFLSGDLAYVADGNEGLYIVNISDPSNPYEVGFYEMWAGANDVYVEGDYAYVGSFFFEVVDISDPANPYQVCEVELGEGAIGVDVKDDYAFCAGDEYGLIVINISDPLNAYEVSSCSTSGDAYGVKVQGNFAYVACLNGSMSVVNINNPNNPILAGFLYLPGWSTKLDVTGDHAYVTAGEGGLRVIDIQVPAQPNEVGVFETPDATYGVFVQGDYAYLANDDGGLRVIGTSDPSNPNEVGHCDISGDVVEVYVSGDYAYLPSDDSTLHVIDISDPLEPIEIGSCFTPCEPFGVFVSGDYAYLGGMYDGLRIIDISTPTAPFEVGFYDTEDYAMRVFVQGIFAYVADYNGGLRVIDVSVPSEPSEVGYCTFDDAQGVFVSGSYAYVAAGGEGLVVVDVSNPNSPFMVCSYETHWACDIYVTGDHAYVADYSGGLRVIDISAPSNPNEVGYYVTPGGAEGVFCSGAFTFIADGMGLQILQFLGGSLAVSATATPDEVCEGESSQLNGYAGGGSGSYSYSWTSDPPGFTSTEQNPIVIPTETKDYIIEVNDGTVSIYDTVTVTMFPFPGIPGTPSGPTSVCANGGNTEYSTSGATNATSYSWVIDPEEAGEISGTSASVTIFWDEDFLGEANLSVAGINNFCEGSYSDELLITLYLPDVSLEPYDTVCVGWSAFELTGGSPGGGVYSGTGVEDGWFDPTVAGVGTHTITYTYQDTALCENSAEQDMVVDVCTGINLPDGMSIGVLPNPSSGLFKIIIKSYITEKVNIKIMNNQGVEVFEELNVELTDRYMTEVNLQQYSKGLYYLYIHANDATYIEKIIVK